jgi:hypothetical protein
MATNRRSPDIPALPPSIEGESPEVSVDTIEEHEASRRRDNKRKMRIKVALMQPDPLAGRVHWVVDTRGSELPSSLEQFQAALPREYRAYAHSRQWQGTSLADRWNKLVTYMISAGGMNPQIVSRALASAILYNYLSAQQLTADSTFALADDDIASSIMEESPMLLIGDMLFKLSPQGLVDGSKGMKILKKRALDRARQQASEIMTNASREASMATSVADEHLARVQRTIRELSTHQGTVMQAWWNRLGYPFTVDGGMLSIYFAINTPVSSFIFSENGRHYAWNALPPSDEGQGHRTHLYLIVNSMTGQYSFPEGVKVSGDSMELPHISYNGGCMTLGDLPTLINHPDRLHHLIDRISDGHSVVNLNSLLRWPDRWPVVLRKQMPPGLARFIADREHSTNSAWNIRLIDRHECSSVTTDDEEADGVFDANQVREAAEVDRHRQQVEAAAIATEGTFLIPGALPPIPGRRTR